MMTPTNEITLRTVLIHPLDLPIYPVVLLILTLLFIAIMAYMQLKQDPLDLRWLIMDRPHRPSLTKIAQVVALAVSTWGFVVLTLSNNLSETYFMAYMTVWSGSAALDAYFNRGFRGSQRRTDPIPEADDQERPSNPYDNERR
jgi:hypothetical protein